MKKHLSVFALFARSSVFKLLLLLLLLAVSESVLFYLSLRGAISAAPDVGGLYTLEYVLSSGRVFWPAAPALVLLAVQLCLTGCNFSGRPGYTLSRLSISRRAVFIWQWLFDTVCYIALWAAQLGIALALCRWYIHVAGETSGQAIMLAFYRQKFLHSLLPLSETSRYVRNLMMVIALGAASARFVWSNHRGQPGIGILAMLCLVLVFFPGETGSFDTDYLMILLSLCVGAVSVYAPLLKEVDDEKA